MSIADWPARLDPAANYDGIGRKVPQRLGFMQFARAIPGYVNQFTGRVPSEFIAQIETDIVEIACPCGNTPRCPINQPTACDCGRTFAYLGGEVRVARSDRQPDTES